MIHVSDTIAATATPFGKGGLSVIRISGENAIEIADTVFRGKHALRSAEPHTAHYGWIENAGERIDEVIATVFRKPHSFTGEDSVEISGHGGLYVTRVVLELLITRGARLAEPGEFTRRAFMNGRIDLAQAEAVADLIHARTEASRKAAISQLQGALSRKLNEARDQLLDLCARLEIELDFSEEDVAPACRGEIRSRIQTTLDTTESLLKTFYRGRICRDGVRLILWGRPNTGKSSLLNALLEKERAIVTEMPGTTRDTIEDVLDINGLCFTIIDTAGIRESADLIEKEGQRRAQSALRTSDMILLVFDSSEDLQADDQRVISAAKLSGKPAIAAMNKSDLPGRLQEKIILENLPGIRCVPVCSLTGDGIDALASVLEETALRGESDLSADDAMITQARHAEALTRMETYLKAALRATDEGLSQEFIAADIRLSLDALGEITGHTAPGEILDKIFAEFCIGK